MASKNGLAPVPRRTPDAAIAAAIAEPVAAAPVAEAPAVVARVGEAPAKRKAPKQAEPSPTVPSFSGGFEKLSLSVSADVAQQLRVLAIVEKRVSESAVVEAALRAFLALPSSAQSTALKGYGRRRKG